MADRVASRQTEPRRNTVEELRLLLSISRILDQSPDLKQVIQPVLNEVAEHLGLLRGAITLLDRETDEIIIETAYGLSEQQRRKGRYRLGEGITGRVVETGEPTVIPHVEEASDFLDRTESRTADHAKEISFICVPIKTGNETLGAFSVDRPKASQEELEEDLRLLQIICSMIAQAVKVRQSFMEERRRLLEENTRLHEELQERFRPANIVGKSKPMQAVFEMIARASQSDTTVLIRGESGTGKELAAQSIHYNSRRAEKPFVKVNCASLPENVIESELFGHEKGAVPGAIAARKGRLEMAAGGTVFLDEIGDLSPTTQVKLLRVLQDREIERLGGNETIRINARVIAATNKNLEQLLERGAFREDLYYRLSVFPIHLPPVRERKSDIPLLADYFVEKYARESHVNIRRISTPAIDLLMSYHWPGNVRELENCIERAILLSTDEVIHSHHLPPTLQSAESTDTGVRGSLQETLDSVEREVILDALKSTKGNMARAARLLGITERIMGLRVQKHGIDPRQYRE